MIRTGRICRSVGIGFQKTVSTKFVKVLISVKRDLFEMKYNLQKLNVVILRFQLRFLCW